MKAVFTQAMAVEGGTDASLAFSSVHAPLSKPGYHQFLRVFMSP